MGDDVRKSGMASRRRTEVPHAARELQAARLGKEMITPYHRLIEAAKRLQWHLCPDNIPISFMEAWRELDAALHDLPDIAQGDVVEVPRELMNDIKSEMHWMYDHIGGPLTPDTTSTLMRVDALLSDSETGGAK